MMGATSIESVLGDAKASEERDGRCACGATMRQTKLKPTNRWVPSQCNACIERERDAFDDAERRRRNEERRAQAVAALDVPLLYSRVSLDTLQPLRVPRGGGLDPAAVGNLPADLRRQARVVELARKYLALWPDRQNVETLTFPQIVIFTGGTGTGKGHVAWSIAKHVASEYFAHVVFTPISDCILDLREAWNARRGDGPSEAKRLNHYRRAALLVLDDVSTHTCPTDVVRHLYDLLAYREQRLLPTIVTTNERTPEAIGALLGPANISRAKGWSGMWDFGDTDYRELRRLYAREAAAT